MQHPPPLANEAARCASLHALNLLDTAAEERFDRITRLARNLFGVDIALVSLVDSGRQWFKSRQGLEAAETPRSISFCGHAIAGESAFVVEDAQADERFADNPLVTGAPHIRFYAGQPLHAPDGERVGTLCLIDSKPRRFGGDERNQLRDLALLVEVELRRKPLGASELSGRTRHHRRLESLMRFMADHFSTRWAAAVPAFLVAFVVLATGYAWERQQLDVYRASTERAALQRLSLMRGIIESTLNAKLHLIHGLSGYVHAGGEIAQGAFESFAAELGGEVGSIRSLQLAPDGVVTYVWPLESNAAAIGHDLLGDANRRAAASQAIRERDLWVAGPLELIQGGLALIGRLPVFELNELGAEVFWGFGTIVIDLPGLWAEVGLSGSDERFRYAMRGRDAMGSSGAVFFGEATVFEQAPVVGEIILPAGSWDLALLPLEGWPKTWPGEWSFRVGAFAIAALVGLLVYFLLRLPSGLRQAIARATSALERNESQFRDAMEALPDGFVIFDANDRLVVCNERFRELYDLARPVIQEGRSYGEIMRYGIQRGMLERFSGLEAQVLDDELIALVQRHRKAAASYSERLHGGRNIRVVERRMRDGGIVSYHMDVTSEIANQQALVDARERAEQANKAKSAFLATISHEVRTPLNGVLGLLSVLREDADLAKKQSEYVATAHESALHLLSILNEILDLSKLEADRLELDEGAFSVAETLSGSLSLVAPQADKKGLDLRSDIADLLTLRVVGDEARLRQVLLNLLSNAIKFTDSGAVTLRARGREIGQQLNIEIEVIDTGIGFESAQAKELFEAFTQVDSDANRRFTGTGLGLAICKRLVDLMGGEISASGAPNAGASFKLVLSLPLAKPLGEQDTRVIAVDQVPTPISLGWPPVRVLLAEDSPTNQMVIRAMLENSGYVVDAVHNGSEAIEAVSSLPYQLILMDVYMPEMDGLSATRSIRDNPKIPRIPIIALTANAMEGDRERFIEAGMDAYLPKPVNRHDLLETLYHWCRVSAQTSVEVS